MAVSTVTLTLNGQTYSLTDAGNGTWTATITAPSTTSYGQSDHTYHGVVVATDDAGNSTTVDHSDYASLKLRVLETVKPTITVVSPTSGSYVINNKPTFTWKVTDAGSGIDTSTISIKIDSGSAITSGITTSAITNGYQCTYTPATALSDGSHTIKYNVSDNDGNTATEVSISVTVDTVAPTLNVTSPADGLITNQNSIQVGGTTNDATSSPVTITINGGEPIVPDQSGQFAAIVNLVEGSNTITVVATDSAGKTTTVVRTVYYDSGAPVISAITITPNPVNTGSSYTITVTVSDT